MREHRKDRGIVRRLDRTTRRLTILLGIPALLALVMMLYFSGRYYSSIRRMDTIAGLKPLIEETIPEGVWSLVSGRETLAETTVFDTIERVGQIIDAVTDQTSGADSLRLVVAKRTMETLSDYANQIRDNLTKNVPVVVNEELLGEIRDVSSLVVSMLNDYITEEIRATAVMSERLRVVVIIGAGVELAILIFAIVLAIRVRRETSRFVREPIEKLEKVTKQLAEGDMSARLPLTDVEELWNLTGQVNIMADNLEAMMRQGVDNERKLKKAELRTLQAQINPHFLYNTLDAIVWKAEAGDEEEVIRLTRALSDFFRISLSSGADWIPIRQEIKHIAGYLSIQKTRYRDILDYEIDIPEECGDYFILKLLLQPLVENALYHGIKFRRGGGRITVSGRQEGDDMVFTVRDTGKGMDEEMLRRLRERMAGKEPHHESGTNGFGLVNVNLRIRLYYNRTDGLNIESGPEGTTVSFRVPCLPDGAAEKA